MKLPKSARIHHRSLQERLFSEGSGIQEFPLKMKWNALSEEELRANFRNKVPDLIGPVQVLVSVPKKLRRKAVDRVLMRRRIREAFRLNRGALLQTVREIKQIRTLGIGLIYIHKENLPYAEIESKMQKILTKLEEKVKQKYNEQNNTDSEERDNKADASAD